MNENKIILADKSLCTGCAACVDVCPVNSIEFIAETELFKYPRINSDTCIGCGKCISACSIIGYSPISNNQFSQKYYYAWNEDKSNRFHSTSGGVGSALALAAIQNGYYVCGATFDGMFNLSHVVSNGGDTIEKIRGSKYLQSDTVGVYNKILILLKGGEKVVFFGTPCQIEGLERIVPQKLHDKLLTCGIICHGVNSPIVWQDFKNYLEEKYNSHLLSYNFRSKAYGWGTLGVEFKFDNGRKVVQSARKNLFHVWFGRHYILRESCFQCKFRTEVRNSDLTIGDFWGIEKILPDLETKDGISVLIASTSKGQNFIDRCDFLKIHLIESDKAIPVLKGFVKKKDLELKMEKEKEEQKKFIKLYFSKSFKEMERLYPCPSLITRLVESIKCRLNIKEA